MVWHDMSPQPVKNMDINTKPSSMYHTTLFKVPRHPFQSTTQPSSKYHTTLFKVPRHPLQSTTPPFSKYHTTLFKVPHNPLQSTTPPSSNYHTTLFKWLNIESKIVLFIWRYSKKMLFNVVWYIKVVRVKVHNLTWLNIKGTIILYNVVWYINVVRVNLTWLNLNIEGKKCYSYGDNRNLEYN